MSHLLEVTNYTQPIDGFTDKLAFGGQMVLIGMSVVFSAILCMDKNSMNKHRKTLPSMSYTSEIVANYTNILKKKHYFWKFSCIYQIFSLFLKEEPR